MKPRIVGSWAALGFGFVLVSACGDSGDTVTVNPDVAPFVGTWDAVVLTMTPEGETEPVVDVLKFADFYITVEPSGQYTATLAIVGNPAEIGQLSVVNSTTLRLDPSYPASAQPSTANYVFQREDYLVLDGPSEFDFNLDGTDDPAEAHFELQRR